MSNLNSESDISQDGSLYDKEIVRLIIILTKIPDAALEPMNGVVEPISLVTFSSVLLHSSHDIP